MTSESNKTTITELVKACELNMNQLSNITSLEVLTNVMQILTDKNAIIRVWSINPKLINEEKVQHLLLDNNYNNLMFFDEIEVHNSVVERAVRHWPKTIVRARPELLSPEQLADIVFKEPSLIEFIPNPSSELEQTAALGRLSK